MMLTPLQRRRIASFRANTRARWSLWIFTILCAIAFMGEFVANDRPFLVSYHGEWRSPLLTVYPETAFGGEFEIEADYSAPEVQCLIISGGLEECFYNPDEVMIQVQQTGTYNGAEVQQGWIIRPLIPFSFDTIDYDVQRAPSAPDATHWLGTDDQARDVLARVIYGFRTSVLFAFIVTAIAAALGILAGAVQGYFGGLIDLFFQRLVEIWESTPQLYVIIIIAAIIPMNFWLLIGIISLFAWTGLVGIVRAEFLRARNFEYIRAARALGISNRVIMWRHVLPNAMVATLTVTPFMVTGAISTLAILDYLGYGLPSSYPSLGELTLQARNYLQAWWLGLTAFVTYAIMLSLLVFIFEGVRDAFDPRKVMR